MNDSVDHFIGHTTKSLILVALVLPVFFFLLQYVRVSEMFVLRQIFDVCLQPHLLGKYVNESPLMVYHVVHVCSDLLTLVWRYSARTARRMWPVWSRSLAVLHPGGVFLSSLVLPVFVGSQSAAGGWWHYHGHGFPGLSRSIEGATLPAIHGEMSAQTFLTHTFIQKTGLQERTQKKICPNVLSQ